MTAAQKLTPVGRIVGGPTASNETPAVATWTPPDEAALDAMPPLHVPKPRPRIRDVAVESSAMPPAPALPVGIAADSTHAYLFHNARETAAVVRTIIRREEGGRDGGPLSDLTPQQVVAALLIGLGEDIGAHVCRHLDGDEIQFVARAITEISEVGHQLAMQALEMAHQRVMTGDYADKGGSSYARGLLLKVLGPQRANHFVDRALHPAESGFDLLKNAEADQIAPFIAHEHPQTIALILSQLESPQAAGVLSYLPERLRADVSYRMATAEKIPEKVLREVEESLEASLRDMFGGDRVVGGPKVVADMLNLTGSGVEKNVLDQMEAQDPEVGESVRNLMFVFADIAKMTDREIQILLRELEEQDLAIALKPADEKLRGRFFRNMSEQARASVQEKMEGLERMLLSEVEKVQLRIVCQVRQLEEKGKVTIVRGGCDETFV